MRRLPHRPLKRLAWALAVALAAAVPLPVRAGMDLGLSVVHIPLPNGHAIRADDGMVAGVYSPPGSGPFPVVVYSHGRSGTEAERSETALPDPRGFVRYWVRKGFVVVAPIRPGYGATGGVDREDSGVLYDIFGNCWGRPAFARAAAAAAEAVEDAVAWVREQPWADRDHIVLVGTSMGGLASAAAAAANPQGVSGYVNFAGGTGGNGQASPEHSCGFEDMQALLARYGRTTHVPSLWLYARNDSFWGAERPQMWYAAFARGGSDSRFVTTDPVPNADGHQLLGRGSRLWMPQVDRFLAELGY